MYNCQDVGVGCVALTNMQTLTKDYSYNQITLMLHNFHVCAELANQPGLDKIKVVSPLLLLSPALTLIVLDDWTIKCGSGRVTNGDAQRCGSHAYVREVGAGRTGGVKQQCM